jgi:NADH:ubiquinone reductase (H+-translocating)
VVIVGGGFGGLQAAIHLARKPEFDITLVDRRNFHLFQPLAYQVATGALSPGEVCYPLRAIFRRRKNVFVMMAEVKGFDLDGRALDLHPTAAAPPPDTRVEYDTLIVAGGSAYSYFGHPEWAPYAPELKSLEGALDIRARILGALEAAELEPDPEARQALLTFVVVGAGPTGVEMAGQIAEIARNTHRDFRVANTAAARVLLLEAGERVLPAFSPRSSKAAFRSLEKLGVTPMLGHMVTGIDADDVTMKVGDEELHVPARTAIWAAGVTASPLAQQLADATGAEVDRAGRLLVEPDLTLPGHPEVFALGDMVQIRGADLLPGVAPVAMQQGRYAARVTRDSLKGRDHRPFHYRNKGDLATIGRAKAVAELPPNIKLSGLFAWVTWLVVHLWYLIGFQNRLLVLIRWAFSFVTHGRGARLITEPAKSHGRPE